MDQISPDKVSRKSNSTDSGKKQYNAAMPNRPNPPQRPSVSPLVYILIPLAFLLGLGGGYLLWGSSQPTVAADTQPIQRVDVSTDDDPSIGPADAPVTIIEFSDYQCPYCQVWYKQVYRQLLASYPDKLRFRLPGLATADASRGSPGSRGRQLCG